MTTISQTITTDEALQLIGKAKKIQVAGVFLKPFFAGHLKLRTRLAESNCQLDVYTPDYRNAEVLGLLRKRRPGQSHEARRHELAEQNALIRTSMKACPDGLRIRALPIIPRSSARLIDDQWRIHRPHVRGKHLPVKLFDLKDRKVIHQRVAMEFDKYEQMAALLYPEIHSQS